MQGCWARVQVVLITKEVELPPAVGENGQVVTLDQSQKNASAELSRTG